MERIHCLAPPPEEPAIPLLTKMLVPAPYEAPKKEASKKVKKTRSGLCRREATDAKSEDSSDAPSSKEEEDEPHSGGGKKRAASSSLEAESPKRGRGSHQEASTPAADNSPEWDPKAQPLEQSSVTEIRIRLCIQGCSGIVILTITTSHTAWQGLPPDNPHQRIR